MQGASVGNEEYSQRRAASRISAGSRFVASARGSAVEPPGPLAPAAFQSMSFRAQPLRQLRRWHDRYGDCFKVKMGPQEYVYVADGAEIDRMLSAPPDVVSAPPLRLLAPGLGRSSDRSHARIEYTGVLGR